VGAREGSGDGSRGTRKLETTHNKEPGCMDRANLGGDGTPTGSTRLTSRGAATEGHAEEGS
jgi:hypothetical protein